MRLFAVCSWYTRWRKSKLGLLSSHRRTKNNTFKFRVAQKSVFLLRSSRQPTAFVQPYADSVKVTVRHQKPSLIFITLTKITSDQLLQDQITLFFIVYKTFYTPSSFKTSWSSFSSCFVFRKQLKKLSLTAKTANCSDRLKTNQKVVETLFMLYAAT